MKRRLLAPFLIATLVLAGCNPDAYAKTTTHSALASTRERFCFAVLSGDPNGYHATYVVCMYAPATYIDCVQFAYAGPLAVLACDVAVRGSNG